MTHAGKFLVCLTALDPLKNERGRKKKKERKRSEEEERKTKKMQELHFGNFHNHQELIQHTESAVRISKFFPVRRKDAPTIHGQEKAADRPRAPQIATSIIRTIQ
jgi:hypothetical protein